MTYLRLVPVASRSAAGASGPAVASSTAACLEPAVGGRRRRPGRRRGGRSGRPIRARGSRPAGSRRSRAASASGGGAGTSSAASSASIAASVAGLGAAGGRAREPDAIAVAAEPPIARRARRRRRRPRRGRRRRDRLTSRRTARGGSCPHVGERQPAAGPASTPARIVDAERRRDIVREAARDCPAMAPWRSSRAASRHSGVDAAASAARRSGRASAVARRRAAAPRPAPGRRPASPPGDGRRRTNRSPARDRDRPLEPEDRRDLAARQVGRVAAAPPDDRADLLRAGVDPDPRSIARGSAARSPSSAGDRAQGDEQPIARAEPPVRRRRGRTRSGPCPGGGRPPRRRRGSAPSGRRRSTRSTVVAVDLDLADPCLAPAGEQAERHRRAPAARRAASRSRPRRGP